MIERAIIADDLTGALDAAAPFAMRGIATAVALSPGAIPDAVATGARIVGVSTDSREIAPEAAHAAVRQAIAALPEGTALFKKVDSRLKGNIAAELDAMPHARSLVVPAIPAFGRMTRHGHIIGFGVSEPIDIAARLGHHGGHAFIPDVGAQSDVERALDTQHDLPIGARALAEAMAQRMAPDTAPPDVDLAAARSYCVIGSTDPITLAQLAALRDAHDGLAYVAVPNGVGPRELPAAAPLTVIQAVPGDTPADGRSVGLALADTLARLAPPRGSLLLISGGATAQVILERLSVRVLELLGEAQPGLAVARANGLTVITKSGGFGDADTLRRLFAPVEPLKERIA